MILTRVASRARSAAARRLPPDSRLGRSARRVARRLGLSGERHTVQVINRFARLEPTATFIQIGANDGVTHDPLNSAIARWPWTGVMVEPVPYIFDRLRQNLASNPRVATDNVAIADTEGTKDFFHLAEAEAGDPVWGWYHALGSFDRGVLLSHRTLIPDIESRVLTTPVDCVTFDTLCARHGLTSVDVIQIDTEGYDHVILGLIDLDRYRPQIVMYEHVHLDIGIRTNLERRLHRDGYEFFSDPMDTVAVRRETLARLPALARVVRRAAKRSARDQSVARIHRSADERN